MEKYPEGDLVLNDHARFAWLAEVGELLRGLQSEDSGTDLRIGVDEVDHAHVLQPAPVSWQYLAHQWPPAVASVHIEPSASSGENSVQVATGFFRWSLNPA